jgi:hypothetical protein
MAGWDDNIFGNLPQRYLQPATPGAQAPALTDDGSAWPQAGQGAPPAPQSQGGGYWWPEILKHLWNAARSGATLPGDVATGKTTMADPATQNRVGDMTQLVTELSGLGTAPEGALTAGAARRAPAVITRANPTSDDIAAIKASVAQTKSAPWPTAQNPMFDTSPEALARNNDVVPQTSYRDQLPAPWSDTKQMPLGGRAQQIIDARAPLADKIASDLQPLTDPSNPFHRLTQFYSTSPILEQLQKQGVLDPDEATQFMRDWAGQGAATSPRTATPQNMRNSSNLLWRRASGDPVPSEAEGWTPAMNEPGFPMMGMHVNLADQFARGVENINTNPKPTMFREGWSGNQADVTADTHNIRSTLYNYDQLNPGQLHPSWFTKQGYQDYQSAGGFKPGQQLDVGAIKDTLEGSTKGGVYKQTEYGPMADPWYDAAQKLGITPAAGQAAGWFNYGPITGLKSPPKILPDLLNDQLEHTSRVLGVAPQKVLDWWGKRKIPLAQNAVPGTTLNSGVG